MRKGLLDPFFLITLLLVCCLVKKTKKKREIIGSASLNQPRENGGKLILPSFADFCLSDNRNLG